MQLGIDFGTTRTVVATIDRGNYPIVSFEAESGDCVDWFPSLVAERNGELRFGLEALPFATDPEWTILRSFKRLLADPEVRPSTEVTLGSTRIPLVELIARYLGALRETLRTRSSLRGWLAPDEELSALVATPAHASSAQRFLTLDAFRRAGFQVQALFNEPSAAGFEYTHRFRSTLSAKRDHIVVYDLGGGTFDASLVRMNELHHQVVATAGLNFLGGDDFDAVMAQQAAEAAGTRLEALPSQAKALLLDRCREAKEALLPQTRRITLDLEGILEAPTAITLSVADFYEGCAPLIEQSLEAMRPVMERLEGEAPREGDDELSDIAGIYVVGGGSALPAVGRVLRERWGRRVHRSTYSFASTAIGLAIVGDPEAGFQLADRFSRYFGVFRESEGGRGICFDPILDPDTPLPAPGQHLHLRRSYHAAHNLGHFRFAECVLVDGEGNPCGDLMPFGEALFPFDPGLREPGIELAELEVRKLEGEWPLIEEEYRVDASGIVEVVVRDLTNPFERRFRMEAWTGAWEPAVVNG